MLHQLYNISLQELLMQKIPPRQIWVKSKQYNSMPANNTSHGLKRRLQSDKKILALHLTAFLTRARVSAWRLAALRCVRTKKCAALGCRTLINMADETWWPLYFLCKVNCEGRRLWERGREETQGEKNAGRDSSAKGGRMLCEDLVERNTDEEHTAGIYGGCDIDLTPGTHLLTGPKRWTAGWPVRRLTRVTGLGFEPGPRRQVARHAIH